ncbi:MAG: NADP-dependent oxidoreductase [Phycisphaerales bacterium]|nr:NADP-dependent oxidoreductase [Phycisphaerales bacterium]
MKAIRMYKFGAASELKYEGVPRPVPGDDDILIRVHAAGVNPVDDKIRAGALGPMVKPPYIPGFDASGVVEKVGKNITKFKPGDAVFTYINLQRGGAYAEYLIAKEGEVALKPAKLSFTEAAAVPLAALTAWQALIDTAKLEAGQTVLIHGGSGGVGSFAVQIAKARGAKVIATASAENQQTLVDLGADVAIDYRAQKFEDIARDVDVVLDPIGGDTQERSWSVLKKGGILVSIVQPPEQAKASKAEAKGVVILVRPNADELAQIGGLIDDGKIRPVVSKVLPLARAAEAHELIATRHTRGKIVLEVIAESPAAP